MRPAFHDGLLFFGYRQKKLGWRVGVPGLPRCGRAIMGSSALVLALDASDGVHLRRALVSYRTRRRAEGLPVPAVVRDLIAVLETTESATERQGAPNLPGSGAEADSAPMALVLDVDEAADALRCSKRSAQRLIAAGELPSVRIAGKAVVRTADLQTYVAGLPATPKENSE
ncbi:MAG: helix-turn-helix domain-containing protein [Jatrophihabitantaceae bacterium]